MSRAAIARPDKSATLPDLLERVSAASSLTLGGGGLVRKPMALAAAIGRSGVSPLDVQVLLGGPEVDLLVAKKKISRLHFAYVGMNALGLAPNFRRARETGTLDIIEASEYLILASWEAAARGIPFMPTKSGLGTDVLTRENTPYSVFACPLTGEPLVAVPASSPDVALLHVNIADRSGNCLIMGDIFGDFLVARAAKSVWVSAETVVDDLPPLDGRLAATFIPRLYVDGVIHAPGGASFTGIYPDYPVHLQRAEEYRDRSTDEQWLNAFVDDLVESLKPVMAS